MNMILAVSRKATLSLTNMQVDNGFGEDYSFPTSLVDKPTGCFMVFHFDYKESKSKGANLHGPASSHWKLLGTSASLVVTSALLVVTRS